MEEEVKIQGEIGNFHCKWGERISFLKKGEGQKYPILGIYTPLHYTLHVTQCLGYVIHSIQASAPSEYTGWPGKHGRVFLVPWKKCLVQCTYTYTVVCTGQVTFTRYQKTRPCFTVFSGRVINNVAWKLYFERIYLDLTFNSLDNRHRSDIDRTISFKNIEQTHIWHLAV